MKKFAAICILVIALCNDSNAQKNYTKQTIEEILELKEEKINLSMATLVLAKEFYPSLRVNEFLNIIDYLTDRFKYYFGKYDEPEKRIRALNTFLYQKGYWNDSIVFCYDDDDLHVTKLGNKYINGYLATRKGSCITMPMLYVLLGEKLGYPIYPVRSAKHFFVRYTAEKSKKNFQQNIEATNGGGYITDAQYKEDVLIPNNAVKNGVYLRTLTKKEYIASLLLINANEYLKQKNIEKAKHYLQLAVKYDSTFSSAYWNYGLTAFGEARQLEEKLYNEKQMLLSKDADLYQIAKNKPMSEHNVPQHNPTSSFKNFTTLIPHLNNLLSNSKIEVNTPKALPSKIDVNIESISQTELRNQIKSIEEKYKPLILAKIKEYKEYTQKAEQLGIVHKFPLEFFEKQIESINQFKRKGGY